jgi:4,5-dihydroxyphthalate decarboxylase
MLDLKIALGDTSTTRALKSGEVAIEGVNAEFVEVNPIIAAFRRMVRERAYDVCEMAPTTYLIARAHGARFTALPIVLMRRFHHHGLVKRTDAGIEEPKDLEGKSVGVRAYSVTTGVWTRGILQNEYGVDPDRVTWMVDDDEHVATMDLPDNVKRVPEGRSLAEMFDKGEIDAGFTGNAGIGRTGAPTAGWHGGGIAADAYPEVIPDTAEAEAEWYGRTGIYPIHAVVVVKDEILADNPWLAGALLDAFEASKSRQLAMLARGEAQDAADKRYLRDMRIVGPDPLPFGMKANAASIDALIQYAHQQRLIEERPAREAVFVNI